MSRADVRIGGVYWAHIHGIRPVRVRIVKVAEYYKGWWAVVLATGRLVRVRHSAWLKPAGAPGVEDGCPCAGRCRVCACALQAAAETVELLQRRA